MIAAGVRDWCVRNEPLECRCYHDPNHGKGVLRLVYGNLEQDEVLCIAGQYEIDELRDDGGCIEALNVPWHVELVAVAPPEGEDGMNRWFFGNFSRKEAQGRHADYWVRYKSQDPNRSLEFFPELPERVDETTKGCNVWTQVLPNSQVSRACSQRL